MTPAAAERLEQKVDKLLADMERVLVIEERQRQDWRRMEQFDKRLEKVEQLAKTTDAQLQQWINRGVGAWAIAATLAAGLKYWPATKPPEPPRVYGTPTLTAPTH